MGAVVMPPWILPEQENVNLVDENTAVFRPAFARGNTQRASQGDPRPVLTRRYRGLSQVDRAAFSAFAWKLKGRFNKFYSPLGFAVRGSLAGYVSELITEPYFDNGTTGWSTSADFDLSVQDRRAKIMRLANSGSASTMLNQTAGMTTIAYTPYVGRVLLEEGSFPAGNIWVAFGPSAGSTGYGTHPNLADGLLQKVVVPPSTTTFLTLLSQGTTGWMLGDYVDVPYFSFSRCAVLDSRENLLLQSETYGTTWTTSEATIGTNLETGPHGGGTADRLTENATASEHYVQQAVTVSSETNLDYCFQVFVEANTRTFCRIVMIESTSSHQCYVDANLSTVALGTPAVSGANWDNPRAFIRDAGNNWSCITIIGRKVSAGTTITCRINTANALGNISYSGSTGRVNLWRACLQQSSLPLHPQTTPTTTTQYTAGAVGDTAFINGLPASIDGLLLPGDPIVIKESWHTVTSVLNSDSAGCGVCKISPALPAGMTGPHLPVMINHPLAAWALEDNASYENLFGAYADFEIRMGAVYD